MYLTKEQCINLLDTFVQESIGLLHEHFELSQEFNLHDFNPNENKIKVIEEKLGLLNKIVESLQLYIITIKN